MFDNINIVLVNTSHPGNIGSSARAMGVMGLSNLSLVNPKDYPSEVAEAMAVGCSDILDNAKVYQRLTEALQDKMVNIAFSARSRKEAIPSIKIDECIDMIHDNPEHTYNVIFGNEKSGLSNDELLLCDKLVTLPTSEFYSSLNLSAAVQIFSYELLKKSLGHAINTDEKKDLIFLAKTKDREFFYQKLINLLESTGYIHEKSKQSLIKKIHIIFNKAKLETHELSILNGILASIEKKINT